MLLLVTSSGDPELALFRSRPTAGVVIPAHLSQAGWSYEVGKPGLARLVTSRGTVGADEISGVLMRTRRVWPSELPHIDANDRDYVASEMTAFLAALISELPCMVLNRPAANSLWGPPFTAEYWWRAAARAGFPVCCNYDKLCPDLASMLLLGMNPVRSDDGLPNNAKDVSVLLAGCAEVGLLEARFCVRHQALQQVSLRPALNEDLVARVEQYCAHPRGPL